MNSAGKIPVPFKGQTGKPAFKPSRVTLPGASLFLLPGLAGFTVFFILPFCVSLGYAFFDKPSGGSFAGLGNFAGLFQNRAYILGLLNTLRFIALSVPLNMGLSLLLALMIRGQRRREWFVLVFLIPLVIPSGSTAFFWKSLLAYEGALNGWLDRLGIQNINWLDSGLALPVMTGIFLWKNIGYNTVLFLAGLGNIPGEQYEAARMDGAARRHILWAIILPGLAPVSITAFMMSVINSFKIFREVYLISTGYPHESVYTLQHFMNNMFVSLNYPKLTTAAVMLVIFIALFTQVLLRLERKFA
ncbi:MAG: sugar ABC transporter permease [Spirochaetaceae bacterium]|jgi:multiple sugar transport system permease protein|nr:sugar ABC transporter permease [Spirochaetaceae bacterium]